MTDVVLINPTAHAQIYQGLSHSHAAFEPPVWIGLLSSALKAAGFSVEVIDAEGDQVGYVDIAKQIDSINPKLTAIVVYGQQPSASTQNMHGASLTCNEIKQQCPTSPVILIGGHVSALPERTLKEEQADFVCQGEGIHTLTALLQTNLRDQHQLQKVPGLVYWGELGQVIKNPPPKMVPMDELAQIYPSIDYDALPMQSYRAHNWHCYDGNADRGNYASIYTSLGCPFTCSFCCINAPFGNNRFRYWSPEHTVKQIDYLVEKFNIRNLKIADEMFVLKEPHFLEICKLLAQRDYKLNIWAYARIDTVRERNLEYIKKAGINWLGLGIESVSLRVRDDVIKGKFNEDRIAQTVQKIQQFDIHAAGNFIFGLPEDDLSSMKENLDYAMSLDLDMANFYSAMAYPGSQLYNQAITAGKKLPDSWLGYSQHAYETLPLSTNYISAGEVLAFRDKAWQAFHTDPLFLSRMARKFGQPVSDGIVAMTKYILPRKHAANKLPSEIKYSHFDSTSYQIPSNL